MFSVGELPIKEKGKTLGKRERNKRFSYTLCSLERKLIRVRGEEIYPRIFTLIVGNLRLCI